MCTHTHNMQGDRVTETDLEIYTVTSSACLGKAKL